jgi:hypothetical protein
MIKILVDRARPTTEEIKNRQNFDSILKKASLNENKKNSFCQSLSSFKFLENLLILNEKDKYRAF